MCAKMVEYNESQTLDCDNPDCDYQEPVAGRVTKDLIDTPCPKCGESLLTEEDYNDSMQILSIMKDYADVINSMSEEEIEELTKDVELPESVDKDDYISLNIKCHNGEIEKEISIIKK